MWLVVAACNTTNIVAPTEEQGPEPANAGIAHRLTQTDDNTVGDNLAVACADAHGTLDNTWYRVFSLREQRLLKPFAVNRVNFGVQSAVGTNRVKVSLGTYAGDAGAEQLDLTKIDTLAMTTIPIYPTSTGEVVQANFAQVEIPGATNLIVEIRSEGHQLIKTGPEAAYFYLGATESTETIAGYLRAPACSVADPLMTSALGYVKSHLIISVSGTD
jgi:hypothetical protein